MRIEMSDSSVHNAKMYSLPSPSVFLVGNCLTKLSGNGRGLGKLECYFVSLGIGWHYCRAACFDSVVLAAPLVSTFSMRAACQCFYLHPDEHCCTRVIIFNRVPQCRHFRR